MNDAACDTLLTAGFGDGPRPYRASRFVTDPAFAQTCVAASVHRSGCYRFRTAIGFGCVSEPRVKSDF